MDSQDISFLHIGKTGGTAIKDAWTPLREGKQKSILITTKSEISYKVKFCGHGTTVNNLGENELFMFCIRDPIQRFVSGFNSRLRKGRPRYNCPWMESEKIAFSKFKTPNKLAEGLSSANITEKASAQKAMKGIRHVKNPISQWTGTFEEIMEIKDRIFFIFNQETLNDDHDLFLNRISICEDDKSKIVLRKSHVGDASNSTKLSALAVKNLQHYYKEDIVLHERLLEYKINNFS